MEQELRAGARIIKTYTVTQEDTAKAVGSGGLCVLATPRLAAWMENIAWSLMELYVGDAQTTVGTKLELNHTAATPVDGQVEIEVELAEQDGRRIVFRFSASDERGPVANGIHERFIVNSDKFMAKVTGTGDGAK